MSAGRRPCVDDDDTGQMRDCCGHSRQCPGAPAPGKRGDRRATDSKGGCRGGCGGARGIGSRVGGELLASALSTGRGEGIETALGRRRWGAAWLGVLVVILGALTPCEARHFRFGAISYERNGGTNEVTFRIESQWRRSFSTQDVFTGSGEDGRAVTGDVVDIVGVQVTDAGEARPIVFETGDGGEYPVALTVTHYSTVEDYVHGSHLGQLASASA
ncbi:hypothetical protein T484DRAFT_1805776 [Baffinella frigidus]|nr:hypothetical protein T484DRAFT_1805776 [Cryptophyta sp. CCMP2293]